MRIQSSNSPRAEGFPLDPLNGRLYIETGDARKPQLSSDVYPVIVRVFAVAG